MNGLTHSCHMQCVHMRHDAKRDGWDHVNVRDLKSFTRGGSSCSRIYAMISSRIEIRRSIASLLQSSCSNLVRRCTLWFFRSCFVLFESAQGLNDGGVFAVKERVRSNASEKAQNQEPFCRARLDVAAVLGQRHSAAVARKEAVGMSRWYHDV